MILAETHWFIIQNDGILLLKDHQTLPTCRLLVAMVPNYLRHFYLGKFNQIEYYCAEIGKEVTLPEPFEVVSLRQALTLLTASQYPWAVKAYSVIKWDSHHQFCGRCGCATVHQSQSFERVCSKSSCGLSFFPRISPSIIVLIRKGEQLLMARSPHFLPGVYGLIAGFVEVGESLEEAVHREVMEEVGLRINNLVYCYSQQWPFPDSLMVGYMADYEAGEITIDGCEIEEAGWYRYDELPGRPSLSISIAAKLLDDFIKSRMR